MSDSHDPHYHIAQYLNDPAVRDEMRDTAEVLIEHVIRTARETAAGDERRVDALSFFALIYAVSKMADIQRVRGLCIDDLLTVPAFVGQLVVEDRAIDRQEETRTAADAIVQDTLARIRKGDS